MDAATQVPEQEKVAFYAPLDMLKRS